MIHKLLFLASCLWFVSASAQNYIPLLDNTNEWHLTTCYYGCNTDVYNTDGDTLVDQKTYKILTGYHFISRTFLLREEIAYRKVYLKFLQPGINKEYLLYDFSLQIGDSIDMKNPITPFPTNAGYYKLDSIVNRPMANAVAARHFYLSPTESNMTSNTPAVWIEGVGSLSIITAPSGYPDINGVGHLSCSFKNGELFYSNLDSISSCDPFLSNMIIGNALEKVLITNIISDGQCKIDNAENIRDVVVFDLSGKKLMEVKSNRQNQVTLDFSKFSAGVYILAAYSEKFEKKVFKLIVN